MELEQQLDRFVRAHLGAQARVTALEEADGHAGLTFLFDVADGPDTRSHVLKLAPQGVRRSGNTDVYRQAPLLRALHAQGLPAPAVPFAGEDEAWFGVPYVVMDRLPGITYQMWDPHPSLPRTAAFSHAAWGQAAQALPGIHSFDWQRHLPGWQQPQDLLEQVTRWRPIYLKAPEPAWIEAAEAVEQLLLKAVPAPADNPVGLFHGDYQPGNILYRDGVLTGVIDWELAGIGSQLLDVGWMLMMTDRTAWTDGPHWLPPLEPAEIVALYEDRMRRRFPAIPWFRALAGFRMGAIGCLNVRLHRKGQRHDPMWERVALGIPDLFGNARAVLEGRR
ncbi:phosphotransferase family protein [Zavarzinia sp. CC-PAN008]|uniref:phosphotransferase family protein n=1 Tax=Zavarzinia sp. CC-PAN008 TaxID=3243332 RepID=UPI003F743B28